MVVVDLLDVLAAVAFHEHRILPLDLLLLLDLLVLHLVMDVDSFQQVLVFSLLLHDVKGPSRVILDPLS